MGPSPRTREKNEATRLRYVLPEFQLGPLSRRPDFRYECRKHRPALAEVLLHELMGLRLVPFFLGEDWGGEFT